MNKEEIEKIVTEVAVDVLGVDADVLSADTNLQETGADSLDAVEIIISLEREFGVKFPDHDIFNTDLNTIADITKFVEDHLNA